MIAWYSRCLEKHPIITKSTSNCILFSIGDIINQTFFLGKGKPYNIQQTINMGTMGFFFTAPSLHLWYIHILPKITNRFCKGFSKVPLVLSQIALDQLLMTPILFTLMFPVVGMIKKRSAQGFVDGIDDIKKKLWETLLVNWKIWPAAMSIGFWFVPMTFQVLYVNFVGVFWSIILSFQINKE